MKKVALITIHGMGKTDSNYAESVFQSLSHILRVKAADVTFHSVYYDKNMQERESNTLNAMMAHVDLKWSTFRELALYGLADAVGLESRRRGINSDYLEAQESIASSLLAALRSLQDPSKPVIFLAHSLGGQVLSNYIWDAQHQNDTVSPTSAGIWTPDSTNRVFTGLSTKEVDFLRLNTMHRLYTTGCNIPIFTAALAHETVIPISKPNQDFQWHNYFDVDDFLGWPLTPLGGGYETLVTDHNVNAGSIFKSWSPLSHNEYWSDNDVLAPLVKDIIAATEQS